MRGALVPPTWRICWVQDAHYAHGRALRAADLHQERIRRAGLMHSRGAKRGSAPGRTSRTFATEGANLPLELEGVACLWRGGSRSRKTSFAYGFVRARVWAEVECPFRELHDLHDQRRAQ